MNMIYFDPLDPILERADFTRELLLYSNREKNHLFIVKEGMEPIVEIGGIPYQCRLVQSTEMGATNSPDAKEEQPLKLNRRRVYLYPIEK
ncbi:MAG: hypothetical protein Q4G61_09785 [Tissierellia bacterium]|nr:hypothetical protein [Tissierellia bacterium]